MKNLSLNYRGYRRITPLGASTLLWLNGSNARSRQDTAAGTVGGATGAILTGGRAPSTVGGVAACGVIGNKPGSDKKVA